MITITTTHVQVTSWDTDKGGERTEFADGRSFINCVTQFDDSDKWSCGGRSNKERGECRCVCARASRVVVWGLKSNQGVTTKAPPHTRDLDLYAANQQFPSRVT